MKSIHINQITKTVEIVSGFEVDYDPQLPNKDYNNGGVWGKIINRGSVVESMKWNPNVWKGSDSYREVLRVMKSKLIGL